MGKNSAQWATKDPAKHAPVFAELEVDVERAKGLLQTGAAEAAGRGGPIGGGVEQAG